jgi:LmbE family N-acetylglucosaminyl deacetylase
MDSVPRRLVAVIALALFFLISARVNGAAAANPECGSTTGRTMVFVAHEDDNLLFMNPRLQSEFESGRCVRQVFLTAGDDGQGQSYWHEREVGMEAAVALIDGVANAWTGSTVTADGHSLRLRTLTADPRISLLFMRLPDGGNGEGFPLYGMQSLRKLWYSHNPCSGCVEASTITSVDGANTFDYEELIGTLGALMSEFEPRQIFTQNYEEVFNGIDHNDHVATALFTLEAQENYLPPHRLTGFWDYNTETLFGPNVTGAALATKKAAFYTYGAHDPEVCSSDAECVGTQYKNWLEREYIRVEETHGVVADAGFGQQVTAGQQVTLDGTESSDESGDPLSYEWTQIGGPSVALSDPDAARPTFTMVSHPTLLTFQLQVTDGGETSPPDFVRVRVPAAGPTPMAEIAPVGMVAPGATVKLDGSGSWDPNGLPLTYEWKQMNIGTPVVLSSTTSATPEFVAPIAPTKLGFELVVANGSETGEAAKVEFEVFGVAPTLTGPAAAELVAGDHGEVDFSADGSPVPALAVGGELPSGLVYEDNGDGTATLAGTPSKSVAAPGGSRVYRITVKATNSVGMAERPFELTVAVPPNPNPGTPTETPRFTSADLVHAFVGRGLDLPITAEGRPTPTISLDGGLPPGLMFRADGAGAGRLTGTPRARGDYTIPLSAGGAGTVSQQLRLVLEPLPSLSVAGLRIPAGRAGRRGVSVAGPRIESVRCLGATPRGLRCVVAGRRVRLVGRAAAGASGVFDLRLAVTSPAGTVTRHLHVRVVPVATHCEVAFCMQRNPRGREQWP